MHIIQIYVWFLWRMIVHRFTAILCKSKMRRQQYHHERCTCIHVVVFPKADVNATNVANRCAELVRANKLVCESILLPIFIYLSSTTNLINVNRNTTTTWYSASYASFDVHFHVTRGYCILTKFPHLKKCNHSYWIDIFRPVYSLRNHEIDMLIKQVNNADCIFYAHTVSRSLLCERNPFRLF